MNENAILAGIWRFLRSVGIIDLVILVGVGLSFLLFDGFSAQAYSDRLAGASIGAFLVGGLAVFASLGSYSTLGTPSIFTAGADSRIAYERIGEHLRMNSKRYSFIFKMLAVGITCLGISALIGTLSNR